MLAGVKRDAAAAAVFCSLSSGSEHTCYCEDKLDQVVRRCSLSATELAVRAHVVSMLTFKRFIFVLCLNGQNWHSSGSLSNKTLSLNLFYKWSGQNQNQNQNRFTYTRIYKLTKIFKRLNRNIKCVLMFFSFPPVDPQVCTSCTLYIWTDKHRDWTLSFPNQRDL